MWATSKKSPCGLVPKIHQINFHNYMDDRDLRKIIRTNRVPGTEAAFRSFGESEAGVISPCRLERRQERVAGPRSSDNRPRSPAEGETAGGLGGSSSSSFIPNNLPRFPSSPSNANCATCCCSLCKRSVQRLASHVPVPPIIGLPVSPQRLQLEGLRYWRDAEILLHALRTARRVPFRVADRECPREEFQDYGTVVQSLVLPLEDTATAGLAVRTHCPYCAFQCGILMPDGPGRPRLACRRRPALPGQQRPALHQGVDRRRACSTTRPAHRRRCSATPRGRLGAGELGRRPSTRRRRAPAASATEYGPGRRRRVRVRGADQREGVPARQVRPAGAGHAAHRLQRPLLHVAARRPARTRRSASTAGCRSRSATSRGPRSILLVGANSADTLPPIMQWFDQQKAAGGRLIVADPRRTADRPGRRPPPAAHPRQRPGPGQRPAVPGHRGAADRPGVTSRPGPPGSTPSGGRC